MNSLANIILKGQKLYVLKHFSFIKKLYFFSQYLRLSSSLHQTLRLKHYRETLRTLSNVIIPDTSQLLKQIPYHHYNKVYNTINSLQSTKKKKYSLDKKLRTRMQPDSYIVKRNCFTDDTTITPTVVHHWLSHRWRYFSGFTHLTNLFFQPRKYIHHPYGHGNKDVYSLCSVSCRCKIMFVFLKYVVVTQMYSRKLLFVAVLLHCVRKLQLTVFRLWNEKVLVLALHPQCR